MEDDRIQQLQERIAELEAKLMEIEQQNKIVVVGEFDGTNVPVLVNGIRRKIATAAP